MERCRKRGWNRTHIVSLVSTVLFMGMIACVFALSFSLWRWLGLNNYTLGYVAVVNGAL